MSRVSSAKVCPVVKEYRVKREELQEFARDPANIDLARTNTPYHRESAANQNQVNFIEQLRRRYAEMRGYPGRLVIVKKYKLPENFEMEPKTDARRCVLLKGLYRPDCQNHVDFANKNIGGGFLTYGMAQEEVMCCERTDFGMLVAMMYAKNDPITIAEDEALVVEGADYCCGLDFYGRVPDNWEARSCYFKKPEKNESTMVAIDCIRPKFKKYERHHLEWCIKKAYCGFQGVESSEITTGQWGCGAFFNNKIVMFCVQAMAAWLANKKLYYHAGYRHVGRGLDMVARWGKEKVPFAKCLDELVELCAEDPEFETSYDPDLVQEEFPEVKLAGNIETEDPDAVVVPDSDKVLPLRDFMEYAKQKWADYGEPKGKGKGGKLGGGGGSFNSQGTQ